MRKSTYILDNEYPYNIVCDDVESNKSIIPSDTLIFSKLLNTDVPLAYADVAAELKKIKY